MGKVIGIHMLALHPGVKAEDFEQFVQHEVQGLSFAGQQISVLKGDRGDREGKYLYMIEFESETVRDRLFPRDAPPPAETQAAIMTLMPILEKWATFATPINMSISTDYRLLAGT
jgi:hypothetical protein